MFNRASGVLLHISSLPGKFGIGTFGDEPVKFAQRLARMGCGAWQILPLGPTDSYNSPYASMGAYAGNVFFIDPKGLYDEGLLTEDEVAECVCENEYVAQYEHLKKTRVSVFRKAYARLDEKGQKELDAFIEENSFWLPDYALFRAIGAANSNIRWQDWDLPLKKREADAIKKASEEFSEEIRFNEFLQWKFYSQWFLLKKKVNALGVHIIGDMPMYLASDSSDLWANPQLFELDENLDTAARAGVPPDYFCEDGQLWGNPLYMWSEMEKDGYSWWISRLKFALKMYDAVRIDHFRAFSAYYSIPKGKSAREGEWIKGPGMKLFSMLKKECPNAAVIAEDLGDVDEDVKSLVKKCGFPGMRVMQFAFLSDTENTHLPHNYERNTVAYTGTHDNNTILGYLWEAGEIQRKKTLEYIDFSGDWGKGGNSSPVIRAMLRSLWQSVASIVIVPIQDLCGFGSDTKMNRPGTAEGNWEFRVTNSALDSIDTDYVKRLNEIYGRKISPIIKKSVDF
ncbi:MAG: 4-alpha-glucanotransferase [Clostridia bacterium]|nr:4-alpha-glucanotransferase [Clostridia bacterium]